ncbi:MAG: formylglycine-generating enzyme family protein, partial [Vicinamibacteraceae bacterium]
MMMRDRVARARPLLAVLALLLVPTMALRRSDEPRGPSFQNSIDVRMVRIPAGSFQMGNALPTDHRGLGQSWYRTHGDYDETPVHDVRISRALYISETEITVDQFQQFRQEYHDAGRYSPSVTGVSYAEAEAFCRWLTARERRPYRLPTEAEWEYVARAGSTGHFSSGSTLPRDGEANAFGVKNMHTGALEWVADWYGPYRPDAQDDPVGPASGWGRVVRGGGPQGPRGDRPHGLLPYYRRSANRASAPVHYRGMHPIGFRIVMGEPSRTPPYPVERPLPLELVKQREPHVTAG